MDTGGMISILQNFGAFGLALTVVGGAFWAVWKKIIEPQLKDAKKDQRQHIETLNKIIENHSRETSHHIQAEKENIVALKELNGRISTHHEIMQKEHEQGISAIKEYRRRK